MATTHHIDLTLGDPPFEYEIEYDWNDGDPKIVSAQLYVGEATLSAILNEIEKRQALDILICTGGPG